MSSSATAVMCLGACQVQKIPCTEQLCLARDYMRSKNHALINVAESGTAVLTHYKFV